MSKFKIPSASPTTNKTVRFPNDVVEEVEKAIRGTSCTFSAFVIAAVKNPSFQQKNSHSRNGSFSYTSNFVRSSQVSLRTAT